MQNNNLTRTLANGNQIPSIGFGTWQLENGPVATKAVLDALACGYRMIDTAWAYRNEPSVAEAIEVSGLTREELFITTKLDTTMRGYEKAKNAIDESLKNLKTNYIDLYLVHWPASAQMFDNWQDINNETWRAIEEAYESGKVKAIGVSNFRPHHLIPMIQTADVMPMVNQIEFHPGYMQDDITSFCRENDILIEAWSPLGSGRLIENETLKTIADKYHKSVAQLCLRWCIQHGIIPLPKSTDLNYMKENLDVFDFEISESDMVQIDAMPMTGFSDMDPDKVNW